MAFGEPFVYGGQETFVYNIYKNNNNSNISFDFYTPYKIFNTSLNSILSKNDNFFSSNKTFNKIFRKINFIISFKKFINENVNNYDIIHFNSGSSFVLAKGAKIAKKAGVKKVVVHSHASGVSSFKHNIINKLLEKDFKYVDVFLACSIDAAKFRFPKFVIENGLYRVIANGIDLQNYSFDVNIREKYRKELKINDDEILLGNVGRLSEEKNQLFLLNILYKLNLKSDKYRLLLIGDGPDKSKIIDKIEELNLKSKVIMLEKRNDINNLLMAMDIFVFPSYYEGLGIALIEAEVTGLPAVCSSGIPDQAIINDNCIKMKDFSEKDWINIVLTMDLTRKVNALEMEYYSIKNTLNQLIDVYEREFNRK